MGEGEIWIREHGASSTTMHLILLRLTVEPAATKQPPRSLKPHCQSPMNHQAVPRNSRPLRRTNSFGDSPPRSAIDRQTGRCEGGSGALARASPGVAAAELQLSCRWTRFEHTP